MVTTRKSTGNLPRSKRTEFTEIESDGSSSEASHHERPKKRARTRESNKRKTRHATVGQDGKTHAVSSSTAIAKLGPRRRLTGRLAMMMSMPVDVFCEIAYYLAPDDLLRLSRASRTLRELLLSKSSKPIWRAAEEAVGLPECPLDLSSPQYASFVFDTFCTHCINARAYKHNIVLRVRLCQTCSSTNIVHGCELLGRPDMSSQVGNHREICMLVPAIYMNTQCMIYDEVAGGWLGSDDFAHLRYYLPHFEAALTKYLSLKPVDAELRKFVDEKHEMVRQIWLGWHALDKWLRDMKRAKVEDNRAVKIGRQASVITKLEELGYTKDDFNIRLDEKDWKWGRLIDQPRALTERIWNSIRPQLEETIRLRRAKNSRLDKERRAKERTEKLVKIAEAFVYSDSGKACLIFVIELLRLPLAQEAINSDEPGTEISQIHWDSLQQQILELSEARKRKIENEASSMISNIRRESGLPDIFAVGSSNDNSNGVRDEDVDHNYVLQLATSFFKRRNYYGYQRLASLTELMKELQEDCKNTFRFDTRRSFALQFGPPEQSFISIADALYRSIGVDAKTMDDMSALGKSFVCVRCDPVIRELMSWTELVNHFYLELTEYEKTEKTNREIDENMKPKDIHGHDETKPGQLAAYTGIMQQYAEAYIRKCVCEMCRDGKSFFEPCIICRPWRSFCKGKLDAHMRTTHRQDQV